MQREREGAPGGRNYRAETRSPSLGKRWTQWVKAWWYHRRISPQLVSRAVSVLVSRREPHAALAVCELAQGQQPQNVHAYTYAIYLALECRQREHRAVASYVRGHAVLADPRAKELLTSYFLYRVGNQP